MKITTLVESINQLPQKQSPYIIGIDGFGGSGKSTLAHILSEHLQSNVVVAMDDFIDGTHLNDSDWELTFKREDIKAKVLSLSDKYIIVEGISSTHPSLASMYDFTVWVDTPIDIAKKRGKTRDKGNENEGKWDLWAANDLKYFEKYSPIKRADTVITNSEETQ